MSDQTITPPDEDTTAHESGNTEDTFSDLAALSKKVDELADDLKDHKESARIDIRDLWIGLVVVFCMIGGSILIFDMFRGAKNVITRDDTVEALLTPGVHCFDSHEEMAAARQRALAAIDRINWAIDNPPTTSAAPAPYPVFQIDPTGPPPQPTPPRTYVVDATYPGLKKLDDHDDVDKATCFGISKPLG